MQVLKEAVRNTGLIRKEVIETCYYRFISKKELKNYADHDFELIKENGFYANLYNSQFDKAE